MYSMVHVRAHANTNIAFTEYGLMEITDYVTRNPGCSAADIVDHLSNTLRMRNHGLTSKKVGFFIPRYLKNIVMFTLDRSTGKRIYNVA